MILLYLSCTCRLDVRDFDKSSVEVEVHDVTLDGHDYQQIDDDQEEPPQASRQAVVVTSKDAIGMEKCIVLCLQSTLCHCSCSFMERGVVDQDVKGIMFIKNICWYLLGCFLAM